MDVFKRKKKLVVKEKYLEKYQYFLTDTLAKMSQNIFHILLFQNILSIFFILRKKNLHLLAAGGLPPLVDASAKNAIFLRVP